MTFQYNFEMGVNSNKYWEEVIETVNVIVNLLK